MLEPGTIITTAESHGWGWLAWAADDNNQSSGQCDGNWFCMLYDNFGSGTTPNLTPFGEDVVLNADYGLVGHAQKAAVFQ